MASVKSAEFPHATNDNKTSQFCWIEEHLCKRECVRFVQDERNASKCACGKLKSSHLKASEGTVRTAYPMWGEKWSFSTHTEVSTTDAFGTIEFQGGSHPTKAKYVRLAFDTPPEKIFQLLHNHWGLDIPKLLISVHGGIANFDLQPKLRRVCRQGLFNAAKTTGAWVTTGGTNSGVMRHVGDALGDTLVQSRHNIITIGIAPWGVVNKREDLIGKNTVVPYHAMSLPGSDNIVLNSSHSYFLLVDDGSVGKFGCETALRKSLEKYISQQRNIKAASKDFDTPVVCLLLEGGSNCIRTVLECVTDHPPIPVVIVDGSGRASDIVAFTHKYSQPDGTMPDILKDQLLATISKTFNYSSMASERLYTELMLCIRKKSLITVFRVGEENQDIDQAILGALLKVIGQKGGSIDQMNLTMAWDRMDMARNQIFSYGHQWTEGTLDQPMMDALLNDRVDFVRLLIENGVNMSKWLTVKRLEDLYNQALNAPRPFQSKHSQFTTSRTKLDSTSTLRHLLNEHSRSYSQANHVTLYVIGQVMNKLMGGAYQSSYCRRKFRYCHLANKNKGNKNNCDTEESSIMASSFKYPYSELMVWAVLLRRQKMALFMLERGEETLAKCLVAVKLYKSMIREAQEDEYEIDVAKEISLFHKEFFDKAVILLDHCYKTDDDLTKLLLTYELNNWGNQTCLSLAVAGSNRKFLAHTCCQILLTEMWMGGLRTRKYPSLKVLGGLLFFPLILFFDYRTKEELEMMPQTQEEHIQQISDIDTSDSDSDSSDVETVLPATTLAPSSVMIDMAQGASDEMNPVTTHQSENNLLQKQNFFRQPSTKSKVLPHASPTEKSTSKGHRSRVSLVDISMDLTNMSRIQRSQLHLVQKIFEFYTAPITKYWLHTTFYCVLLLAFIFMMLQRTPTEPEGVEWYVSAYMVGLFFEKIREFVTSEPARVKQKIKIFFSDWWNNADTTAIVFYTVGFALRFTEHILYARAFYSLSMATCICRVVEHFVISPHLGPVVHILGKMIKEFLYLMVFLLVSVVAFGAFRLSMWFPDNLFDWDSVREIFLKPYFMLYGEVYHEIIWPDCQTNITGMTSDEYFKCVPGRWLVPVALTVYLAYGIIVLLSLVIAVFNNVLLKAFVDSNDVWKFQRYSLVIEYEARPILPSPFIIISHVIMLVRFLIRKCTNKHKKFDQGLKVYLNEGDLEKLHDFEEECMEIFNREQQHAVQITDQSSSKQLAASLETILNRLDDIQQRENSISHHLLMMQQHLNKLDDSAGATNKTLRLLGQQMQQLHSNTWNADNDNNSNNNLDRVSASASMDPFKSSTEFTTTTEASGGIFLLDNTVRQRRGSLVKNQSSETGRSRTHSMTGHYKQPEGSSLHPLGRPPSLHGQGRLYQPHKTDSKFHFKPINEHEFYLRHSGDESSDVQNPMSYNPPSKSSYPIHGPRKLPFMPLTPIVTPIRVEYSSITDEIDASFLMNDGNSSPPDTPTYYPPNSVPFLKNQRHKRRKKRASKEEDGQTKAKESNDRLREAEENVNEQMKTIVSRRIRQLSLTEPAEFSNLALDALKIMENRDYDDLSDYSPGKRSDNEKTSSRSNEEIKSAKNSSSSKLKFVRSEPNLEPPSTISMEMSLLTLKEDEEEEGDGVRKRSATPTDETISFSIQSESLTDTTQC